ncbi:MAG: polysaccharide export protein [Flavobacteriales bacterium]|nr:polysaccharide export protein [Flavobacteriales bacterium]MCB9192445.1 polysaccharide export protein [Flavobacteriales bacterium]MCB9204535.1 polysaccharide export protein [Flavobacteriales bacterium]
MKFRPAILLLLFSSVLMLSQSCITRKDISYFQDISDSLSVQKITQGFEARIAAGDILSIHVSSLSAEASSFFNVVGEETDQQVANTYLVDADGNIEMPLIGSVQVGGYTGIEAKENIKQKLDQYLVDPSVNVRIRNFKVTVLGEVKTPGVYTIPNEKITLIEAIGLAGDLTIFGKRVDVLVVREEAGERKFFKVDLRSKELFESDFYYLHSNDIIYVEPGKGKIASADAWYRILPIVLSGLSTVALFLRLGNAF